MSDTRSKCVFVPSREVTLSFVRLCLKLALRKWQRICDTTERHPNTTHTHTRTHKPTRTHAHQHAHTHTRAQKHTAPTHTHKYTPKPTRTHRHTHTHTQRHKDPLTHAHIHKHTQTHAPLYSQGPLMPITVADGIRQHIILCHPDNQQECRQLLPTSHTSVDCKTVAHDIRHHT